MSEFSESNNPPKQFTKEELNALREHIPDSVLVPFLVNRTAINALRNYSTDGTLDLEAVQAVFEREQIDFLRTEEGLVELSRWLDQFTGTFTCLDLDITQALAGVEFEDGDTG